MREEDIGPDSTICLHHHEVYLSRFSQRHNKCFDIFKCHFGKKAPKGTKEKSLSTAESLKEKYPSCIPGHQLCVSCILKAKNMMKNNEASDNEEFDKSFVSVDPEMEEDFLIIHNSLIQNSVSPLVRHAQPKRQKILQARKEVDKITKNIESTFNAVGLPVGPKSPVPSTSSEESDVSILMNELKTKLESSNYPEKIQILTLKPHLWNVEKTVNFFNTSKHAVKKSLI